MNSAPKKRRDQGHHRFYFLDHFHGVGHRVYAVRLFTNNIIPRVFFSGGHTTHHLLSRKRTCIPTAVVVTASSSATRLPPLCTVVLDFSFRNHLHRHCYHRHHRQSKFIECGHTAHHARLRRRTSPLQYVALTPFASCSRQPLPIFLPNFSFNGFRISSFFVNFSTEEQTGRYL